MAFTCVFYVQFITKITTVCIALTNLNILANIFIFYSCVLDYNLQQYKSN